LTPKELEIELEAASRWQEEIELPKLAILATWTAVQTRGKKLKSIKQLLKGKKKAMSAIEMVSNLMTVHEAALKEREKENANEGGRGLG